MPQPLVSILIPCYNGEKWISKCIESALNQTWSHKEVIVIDDGSTDESFKHIKNYTGQISWEQKENSGANITRNRLLKKAQGEWIQYLDADDYLKPEKIQRQMECAKETKTDVIFSPTTFETIKDNHTHLEKQILPQTNDPWELMCRWHIPQTGGLLFKKQALQSINGWDESLPCGQDSDLCFRLLQNNTSFHYCENHDAVYRIWSENTVSRQNKERIWNIKFDILRQIEAHLQAKGQLSEKYLNAINQTRFGMARMMWTTNKDEANKKVLSILKKQPSFSPENYYAPKFYQILLKILGFNCTETIASILRKKH